MLSQEAVQAAGERRDLGAFARLVLELPGAHSGLRGLGKWVRWSNRLKSGTEMPLRLRLIEINADVVAGGRPSGGGEAGSGCLGEADFGAVGHPPWLEGPRQIDALVPSP